MWCWSPHLGRCNCHCGDFGATVSRRHGKRFQAIQEYTGFIAPGIVSVFLLGMFWKGCNAQGAFAMLIVSVLANIALKFITPDLAFVIRIWIVFLSCLVVGYVDLKHQ